MQVTDEMVEAACAVRLGAAIWVRGIQKPEMQPWASAHREEMRSILTAALAAMWQPIETAPKDGSFFDAWVGGEFPHRSTDVSWREPTDSEWWVHGGDTIETPEATWCDDFGPLGKDSAPTHWMPKHPAPSQLSKRDDAERDSIQEA